VVFQIYRVIGVPSNFIQSNKVLPELKKVENHDDNDSKNENLFQLDTFYNLIIFNLALDSREVCTMKSTSCFIGMLILFSIILKSIIQYFYVTEIFWLLKILSI